MGVNAFPCRNRVPIQDLRRGRKSAASQEQKILEYFESRPNSKQTPYAVKAGTGIKCITSVRRAMTILTRKGLLVKEDHDRMEIMGATNKCWSLKKKPIQPNLFE